eukprot:CAMPEP_0178384958 /NCGR_PEP_ID=MMETSP0689_2-20121128/7787_1 /TAXON_ID=160604 /ORGANISM="Amphidinium massartii, Strain CS-259" /LENGTH=141 /DNA_ID=CAMNT_0020005229 /DNA_START=97 /DNA_END=521 /DNA_ORIENTATION=+
MAEYLGKWPETAVWLLKLNLQEGFRQEACAAATRQKRDVENEEVLESLWDCVNHLRSDAASDLSASDAKSSARPPIRLTAATMKSASDRRASGDTAARAGSAPLPLIRNCLSYRKLAAAHLKASPAVSSTAASTKSLSFFK